MKIWIVEEEGVFHWVMAADMDDAKTIASESIATSQKYTPASDSMDCEELEIGMDLKLHCESKPITHTVEDWLIIYGHERRYLGCSEY